MKNKNHDDNIIYYSIPLIRIIQTMLLIIPLLLVVYIYSNQTLSFALSYLYPLVTAGWIMTLGNGRFSINIKECEHIINISKSKFKSFIVVTSAENDRLSRVDFWYQISGYLLIIFGVFLSSSMLIHQYYNNIQSNWMSFNNVYTSIMLIYTISICSLGTVLRVYYLVKDYFWYKRKVHK
ncbi:MAG: hypothetical protein UR53_C0009G0004 [Candidatus Magasanikbacteria bacterium GW2011_GWC2_34_16]|uniref:Uncharacterized protein n=1 Tax=Candidatus Magasanikbacteria bacterium GW2011_GWC2_34_16 TaxID=1619045 RepID=A0A0G0B5Y4_9BACT|nr:MAG: hypothetical protein UR53_C0009G0004 [Candidatus Magasanikbacteria bacterium GW2011_GWC2_34_16]